MLKIPDGPKAMSDTVSQQLLNSHRTPAEGEILGHAGPPTIDIDDRDEKDTVEQNAARGTYMLIRGKVVYVFFCIRETRTGAQHAQYICS